MSIERDFMRRAIELAVENVHNGGGPFAALIVKDGKMIATGVNRVTATNDPTAHAEIVAIRAACRAINSFQLDGCELYTTCEPCPMCMGAIYWARPRKVYYASSRFDAADAGFDDSMIYSELNRPHQERKIPTQQLLRDEALVAFREWKSKADKIPY